MPINLSALTAKQAISAIYIGYYDRAADAQGMEFWLGQYNEFLDGAADGNPGMSLEDIATDFSTQYETRSPDFAGYSFFETPSVASASAFISNVYLNLFDRAPDAAGLAFWTDQLVTGNFAVGEIILKIIEGAQGTDQAKILNKIEVATDWTESAADAGISTPSNPMGESNNGVLSIVDQPAYDSARSVLDGVDETAQSVANAKAATDTFIDGYFNDAPVADDSFVDTNEDAAVVITPDVTDADPGAVLTYTILGQPANGTVVVNANGTFTYTPDADFNGTDSFDYEVTDEWGETATATIEVNVDAVNDAPVAAAAAASLNEDASINGSVSATDVDNDAGDLTFSVQAAGQPANGAVTMNPDGTYTYTPNADFFGTDSFTYTVTDPAGASSTATVTLTVAAVDDAPVAADNSRAVNEGSFILDGQVSADDVDNNNAAITYALTGVAPAGLVLNADGTYTFDATVGTYDSLDAGDIQVVTATYVATSNGKTDTGTITITVTGTNDAPVATAATASTIEDTAVSGTLVATDVDADDQLTYSLATPASNGDVTVNQDGSFIYDPNPDFNGIDSFTYTVTDSQGATSTATVSIGVTPADDVLTVGVDNINGGQSDDVVIGNESTFNAGDNVEGGAGEDTVIVNVNTGGSDLNFAGFTLDVETFQTTIDGPGGSATFDMSGSEITGNTFINANSTADVTYNRVNMNPDGPDADSRPQLDAELRNVTQGADTTFTTRPAEVVGGNDEANVLMSNVDNNAHIGELSFFGTPGDSEASPAGTANSGLEVFDLSVEGSPLDVFLNDLNTPGGTTVNIATDTGPGASGLTIGDEDIPGNVAAPVATNFTAGTATGSITGFDNPVSNTIITVTSSGDGDVALSLQDDMDTATAARSAGATVTLDGGNDTILGSQLGDVISGGDGADVLGGAGGNDSISGQGGNDLLMGDDSGIGGNFNDTLDGGTGNDTLLGGGGSDVLRGGDDNDILMGGDGSDNQSGGAGNDTISTGDATDTANETVNGGAGDDVVHTRGEQLVGSNPLIFIPKSDVLSGGADTDTLVVTLGNGVANANDNGMNDVTQFETINLNDGQHTYVIDNNSAFDLDSTIVTVNASDAQSLGGTSADFVNFNASVLNRAIQLIGGDGSDTLIGGAGNDTIAGDGDNAGNNGGNDSLVGNAGNDTFLTNNYELDGGDTISGGIGNDTLVVQDQRGSSTIDQDVTGIETLEVREIAPGNFTLNITDDFTNGGTTLHVDAGVLANSALILNHNNQTENKATDVDVKATGGAQNDTFNMGENLDIGDTIDGGAGNGDQLIVGTVSNTADADFTNVSNVEVLTVTGAGNGTLVLGQEAFDAGIRTVNASGATGNITINAANFPGEITIIDGNGNNTIIGPNSDKATIVLNGGNDNITTGTADDVIEIGNGDLDANDTITDNGGNDSIEFQNMDNANAGGIAATVNLDNVSGIENYTFEGNGVRSPVNGIDNHTLTFQGGNVGTVTDINVDGSNVTDGNDSLTVVIGGTDNALPNVDVDYRFTIDGTAGDDRLYKANNGLNNQIVFNGGAGSDTVSIFDGDLGGTTTIDGGTGIDWLSQTGGTWTDDDFINVSNVEGLTAESPLVATLGANAAAAGIDRILGTNLNENVLLDAAFTNDLMVDLSNGGDDTIDAGASSATMRFFGVVDTNDITAADQLTGGTGTNDSILLEFQGNGTADLSNTNGVEIVDITEGGSGTMTLVLGNTVNDNANNLLTINEVSAGPIDPFFNSFNSNWDGETFIVDGANYNGAILLNGQVGSTGAVGNITTSNVGNFNDTINAGDANDTVSTNGGNDVIDGGNGNDVADAGAGNDSVDGGNGADDLFGGIGNDVVNGGTQNDTVDGGAGIDTLDGGDGNDLIIGGSNEEVPNLAVNQGDRLTGGNGDDTFRFNEVMDSAGLDHDVITDWGNGNNTIEIDENVLFQAGGAANAVAFAGNAPNFAQAQGTIAATAGDGVADYVFQAGNAVEAPTLWIDVNDDGDLNGQDIQIELEGFAGAFAGGEVVLVDANEPDAPVFTSVTVDSAGPNGSNTDFETNDNTAPVVRVSFSTATDGTGARIGDVLDVTGAPGGALQKVLDATDIANGFVDFTLPAGPIADGTYGMSATVTDTFGTVQVSAAAAQNLVIDTTATVFITSVADDDDNTPISVINSNEEGDLVITGTVAGVEDGQTVNFSITDGVGTVNGSAVVSGGAFTTAGQNIDVSGLNDVAITVTATVTDQQGNVANTNFAATKDTVANLAITGLSGEFIVDGTINVVEDASGALVLNGTTAGVPNGSLVSIQWTDQDGTPVTNLGAVVAANAFSIAIPANNFSTFYQDGPITFSAQVEDPAGNVATDTFVATLDLTPPTLNVTDARYNNLNKQLTINGTFDTSATVDFTQLTIDTLTPTAGQAFLTNFTANQMVVQFLSPFVAGPGNLDFSIGDGLVDDLDLATGFLVDGAGNLSGADINNPVALDISSLSSPFDPMVGNVLADNIEINVAGEGATGNGGADKFILDNIYNAQDASGVIADINDFDASEGDLIQLDASDINGEVAGSPYAVGDDGAAVAFVTYLNGQAEAATNQVGTLIYDSVNQQLRIDYAGDTTWNGAVVNDPGNDDDIIDLVGINGTLSASDIEFLS
ncbi:Ig-like domain-containing protein [Nioella aestuarii]|uniref:Ig-like domain-containing protein n=1 Tax=Nioella aestuarii TaxID=1662864 RepID=UPI003D7F45E8